MSEFVEDFECPRCNKPLLVRVRSADEIHELQTVCVQCDIGTVGVISVELSNKLRQIAHKVKGLLRQ